MVICAYLIYKQDYSANEAISLFKLKRTGSSLTHEGQKSTIKKFEACKYHLKDLRCQKKIFFQGPSFSLSQYITQQMLIRPILSNELDRRTPELIRSILKQLEMLKLSKLFSTEKILASFYDLDNSEFFESVWNETSEKRVAYLKSSINEGIFKVSQETDTRVLCQILLDYLENLTEPAISELTISHLSKITHNGMSSQEILTNQLSSTKPTCERFGSKVHEHN